MRRFILTAAALACLYVGLEQLQAWRSKAERAKAKARDESGELLYAGFIYKAYRNALLTQGANLADLSAGGTDVRAILVDGDDYTSADADDFLDDIAAGARVATTGALSSKAVDADADFDCADWTWSSVTGDQSEEVVLYIHTGTESTSRLIVLLDSNEVTGLPVTPNGGDINFAVNASGLFRLGA